MPDGVARRLAGYRLACERPATRFGQPDADDRLARDVAGATFERDDRPAAYLRIRTAFFDRVVVNGLERGATQVVLIGAGYDGRAMRFASPDVRWFELDDPATQDDKRRRLDRLHIPVPGVTFLAVDVTGDDIAGALTGAGFSPDAPSLLLCEGGVVRLTPDVLGLLRSLATAGTRLALSADVSAPGPERPERTAAIGGPALTGDVDPLLAAARWRSADLSERARRAGMVVGIPVWAPGRPGTASRVGAYLERTFHRDDDGLVDHLGDTYGITITGTRPLDVGVVRVDQEDGRHWVARIFPATRPADTVRDEAHLLAALGDVGYPAERLAHPQPVSEHRGQAVLVTEFVDGRKPRPTRDTFRQLGELLGRLHALPDMPRRPGGAWHHLAVEGGPDAEITALQSLLDARPSVRSTWRPALTELRAEVDALDGLADLPHALTHPDLVPENAIAAAGGDLTVIDWAGAGVAPRAWTLGFLLWAAGRAGPGHVLATATGYRRHIRPETAELDRLEAAVGARPLIFDAWAYATGRRPLPDVAAHRPEVVTQARGIAAAARAVLVRHPDP